MIIYDRYLYERTLSYMIKKIWRFQLNNSAFDGYNGWCLRQYLLIYCQLLIIHPHVTRRRWRPTRTLIFHRLSKGYLHANRGKTLNTKVYLRSNFANFGFEFYFVNINVVGVCWRTYDAFIYSVLSNKSYLITNVPQVFSRWKCKFKTVTFEGISPQCERGQGRG